MSKLSLGVQRIADEDRRSAVGQKSPLSTVSQLAIWEATGLTLPADLTFDEWQAIGDVLAHVARGHQWWMGDWWRFGEHKYGQRAAQALDSRFSYGTWANAGYVAGAVETSRRREGLSFAHHQEVAPLSPAEQEDWLARAVEDELPVMALRTAIRRTRVNVTPSTVLPAGKYSILLADPPWQYDFVEADNRAIENQYPTLTADEIACHLDAEGRSIADLAAPDAVLFLWATNPKLTEAMTVIRGWGFEYVTNMVWVKDRIGMGYWARQRHELLLIARRGAMSPPPVEQRPDSVIEAPRGAHSAKPVSVYELLEEIWPDAPKVEIFGRSGRAGWATYGNQVS